MNRRTLIAFVAMLPFTVVAQNAFDSYQLSRNDLRGTARFMSMGGAFGALGGDLSTLNQNPGGIGIYRKSEVGFTLDIDMQSTQTASTVDKVKDSQTKVQVNNIGYIGSSYTGSSILPYFNWGFSYGRVNSFNRRYRGTTDMNGSLSNYIAGFTSKEGWSSDYLKRNEENYGAFDHAPWMSILAYNSFMINPVGGTANYNGLWGNGTYGVSDFSVEEKGFVDEYEINLGGNFLNTVYWGIGFGIDDIEYQRLVYYEEYLNNAQIPVYNDGQIVAGPPTETAKDVGFGLDSYKHISGTGFNFKAGVIVKPINELRLGLAVHTPTYYNLIETSDAVVDYGYGYSDGEIKPGYTGTPTSQMNWKLRTPWRLMASAAAVLGANAIVSVDYEYRPYQDITAKDDNGYNLTDVNGDIKNYYKAANIIRIGAEYRVSNNFSVRAGYAFESTPTGSDIKSDKIQMFTDNYDTTGTMPSYSLDNSTQYITCGIGYRYKAFYADAAYVHKSRKSEYHPYTAANGYTANPYTAEVSSSNNNIVLSVGFKF